MIWWIAYGVLLAAAAFSLGALGARFDPQVRKLRATTRELNELTEELKRQTDQIRNMR